jgi:translation initiation factor 1
MLAMPRYRNNADAQRVYSTEGGRQRPPRGRRAAAAAAGAGDRVVRVSRTSSGRRGKTVTLVTGLPPGRLKEIAAELKRHCGSGGAVKSGVVEIQGDHRDAVAERLRDRFTVKLAGG